MKKGFVLTVLLITIAIIFISFSPLAEQKETTVATSAPEANIVSAPVSGSTVVEAKLHPAKEVALGFQAGGILAVLNVEKGDFVQKGDVLAVLEGTEKYDLAYAEATLELLQAEKDLKALQDAHAITKANAELALIEAKNNLDEMKKTFEEYETAAYRKKIDDANKAARDQNKKVDDAQELVDDVADLAADSTRKITVLDDFVKVRQEYDKLERAYNVLVNDKNMAEANITSAEAALEDAQRESDELAGGPKQADLDVVDQRIAAAKVAQNNAAKNIELMKIIAPFDGQVVTVSAEIGELVPAGAQIMVEVDPTSMLLKTVDLSETNMDKVKVGNAVRVTFDAFPGRELTGTVTRIVNWSEKYLGDVVFPVEIKLEPTNLNLLWGMTASVYFD